MARKLLVLAVLGVAATGAVAFAQDGGPGGPFGRGGPRGGGRPPISAQDREAFLDARIAGLHAGLKLTADQEKLWPPVEGAVRSFARQRQEAMQARRDRWASMQNEDGPRDIPAALRFMADRQAASADALRNLADASAPLYAALDDGQKRRLQVLARFMRPGGPGMRGPGGRGPMRRGDATDGSRDFAEGPWPAR